MCCLLSHVLPAQSRPMRHLGLCSGKTLRNSRVPANFIFSTHCPTTSRILVAAPLNFQAVAAEAASAAFDNVSSRGTAAGMEAAARRGEVPRPVAIGGSAAGEWLELDPSWRPPGGCNTQFAKTSNCYGGHSFVFRLGLHFEAGNVGALS